MRKALRLTKRSKGENVRPPKKTALTILQPGRTADHGRHGLRFCRTRGLFSVPMSVDTVGPPHRPEHHMGHRHCLSLSTVMRALGTEFKEVSSVADLEPPSGQLPTNLPFCSQLSPAKVLIGTVYLFWALIKSECQQMGQSHLPRQ